MNKINFNLICLFFFALLFSNPCFAQDNNNTVVNIYLFYGQGCSHCIKMIDFFEKIKDKYPQINLTLKEIYFDKKNALLMNTFCKKCNTTMEGIPTVFIDRKVYVGFSYALAIDIENKIKSCITTGKCIDIGSYNNSCEHHSAESSPLDFKKNYSLFGQIFLILIIVISIYYFIIKK